MDLAPAWQARLPLQHPSDVGAGRRAALCLGSRCGLGPAALGRLALLTTEAASNALRHGGGGHLLLRGRQPPEGPGVDVVAVDAGVGMADLGRCQQDGFSTASSPGTGLGAIGRVADFCGTYTRQGGGTVLACGVGVGDGDGGATPAATVIGAVSIPVAGEQVCGDGWGLHALPGGKLRLWLADGLGHGPGAAAATATAAACLAATTADALPAVLTAAHAALRPTRGAALAVVDVDLAAGSLAFAGIGNVAGSLVSGAHTQGLASANGTVGAHMGRVRAFAHRWEQPTHLVLHSDGIGTHWRLAAYPGLQALPAACIAAVLWRDHARARDDATVCVLPLPRPRPRPT